MKKNRKWLRAVAAMLIAVTAVGLASCSKSKKSDGKFDLLNGMAIPVATNDGVIFLSGGKELSVDNPEGKITGICYAMDRRTAALNVEGEGLHLLKNDKLTLVADEDVKDFVLSENGDVLLYVLDGELISYGTDGKKTQTVDHDVETVEAVSPNGKTVVYTNEEDETILWVDGEKTILNEGLKVISVSDKGAHLYCLEEPERDDPENLDDVISGVLELLTGKKYDLYLYEKNKKVGLISSEVKTGIFYTNNAHTQLIFQSEDKWFAVDEGEIKEDRHKLRSDAEKLYPMISDAVQTASNSLVTALGTDDLREMAYYSGTAGEIKLVYVDREWNTATLASKISSAQISDDGSVIYYRKNDDVYKVKAESNADKEKLAEDVQSYAITADGKGLYWVNEDDTLYYQSTADDKKKICNDVDKDYNVTRDGYVLFTSDDILYVSDSKGEKKQLQDETENIRVIALRDATYYIVCEDDVYTVYASTKGTEFTRICEYEVDLV